MKQYGLLAAVFGGTLAVLLVAFVVIEQLGAGGAVAVASPSPAPSLSATPLASPSAAPSVSARPSPSVTPSEAASPTPSTKAPDATPRATPTKPATVTPGETIEVVVLGKDYVDSDIPDNGRVSRLVSGGVLMTSTREIDDPTTLTYMLPGSAIPAGTSIKGLDVAVCGFGEGDFWETYGPADADPVEREVTSPDADGCWHYLGGSGKDTSVKAIIEKASTLRVDKIVYSLKTG